MSAVVTGNRVVEQAAQVETLFLHEHGEEFRVAAHRDGERLFHGILV